MAWSIAQIIREGYTRQEIADYFGCTRQNIQWIMAHACPDFVEPEPPTRTQDTSRPAWSYPDENLLALAREAKHEIEAALRAKRRQSSSPSPLLPSECRPQASIRNTTTTVSSPEAYQPTAKGLNDG